MGITSLNLNATNDLLKQNPAAIVERPPVLEMHEASLVREGKRVLHQLNLRVAQSEHTAILGPNGSGKSSLLHLITRQHYPLQGQHGQPAVTIFGRERWNVFELRSLLGIVSADLHQAFTAGTSRIKGFEAVLSGFFASRGLVANHHEVTPGMRERAVASLTLVEALHLAGKPMAEMSTGEARRILIARSLAPDPRALILDEPTAGLDLLAKRHFLQTVRRIAGQGKTVILVTHQIEEIIPEIERVVLLQDGRIFCDGPKREVLTTAKLSALFGERIEVRRKADYYAADAR